jgi:DNA polymerase/3'-5' exonuclease PolX
VEKEKVMAVDCDTYSEEDDGNKPIPIRAMEVGFINSRHFIRPKIVDGKLRCDKCANPFPSIIPFFVMIDDSAEELLCYPCNYKRMGISVEEFYKSKRKAGELIMNMKEQRMEKSKALQIAKAIVHKLTPFADRIEIAGSLRRMKPDAKDIELVVAPKMINQQDGFFDTKQVRTPEFIAAVNGLGVIDKGSPVDGRQVIIALPDGIKLDLYIPQESDWMRQYAIRTGSADYVRKHIAEGWKKKGWCGTEDGLRLIDECEAKKDKTGKITKWICVTDNPTLHPVWKSEKEFFEFISVPYVEPDKRH